MKYQLSNTLPAHLPTEKGYSSQINDHHIPQEGAKFFEEDQLWLHTVNRSIKDNLANNHYSIKQLAYDVAISERHLRRRLKQLLGVSPAKYLKKIRLEQAKQLLVSKRYKTVTQVANAFGYKDVGSFRYNFLDYYGHQLGDYLKK